jgi:large-conductance mechanosensitive channel
MIATGVEILILSALAVYLGSVFTDFFHALSKDVILPLAKPFVGVDKYGEELIIPIGKAQIKVGDLFIHAVSLVVAVSLIVVANEFMQRYASGFLKKIYK